MKEIVYYRKENWKIPIKLIINFLKENNPKILAKLYYKLDLLKFNLLWINDIKYLKEWIYELRIKENSNIIRTFYFLYNWDEIILIDWFIKKDNKLKSSILNKVIKYKKDYLKRIWLL